MRLAAIAAALGIAAAAEERSFDGTGNNLNHPDWGAAGTAMPRLAPPAYGDGLNTPAGTGRPNPRDLSNLLCAQTNDLLNSHNMSDMVWLWGQFVDHDIVLSRAVGEPMPIPVPSGDPSFDPMGSGAVTIPFSRTEVAAGTGATGTPREQVNSNSAFIDGSGVYGSDAATAAALRSFVGGRLLAGPDGLLPKNTMGLPMDDPVGNDPMDLFAAGDIRANEHAGLTCLHTLFVREHNRRCDELAALHPEWTDEQLYQRARLLTAALIQSITYNHWLPHLIGAHAPGAAGDYDPDLDPGILNEFATAFFRVGHTMVNRKLMRVADDNFEAEGGSMLLRDAFFDPALIDSGTEMEFYLKGMASRRMQNVDIQVVEEIRSFLFGPPGAGGLDLGALNIQRGRDHGLPDYNSLRVALGLPPRTGFGDITSDPTVRDRLLAAYGDIDDIDAWVGALSESHEPGAAVGETIAVSLAEQFRRLRDGDRFFYNRDPALSAADLAEIEATSLTQVIQRNSGITRLQTDIFLVIPEPEIVAQHMDQLDFRVDMEWMSDSAATYRVEAATDVFADNWVPISEPFDGRGSMIRFISENGNPELRFFRLRQYP